MTFNFHISQEMKNKLLLTLVQYFIVCWNLKTYKCNTTKAIHEVINWRLALGKDLTSCFFVTFIFYPCLFISHIFITKGLLVFSVSFRTWKFSAQIFPRGFSDEWCGRTKYLQVVILGRINESKWELFREGKGNHYTHHLLPNF